MFKSYYEQEPSWVSSKKRTTIKEKLYKIILKVLGYKSYKLSNENGSYSIVYGCGPVVVTGYISVEPENE